MDMKLDGVEKLQQNLNIIQNNISNAVLKVVTETTLQVEADAKKSMKGGASGKYRSSPGEPPYVQTGNLRSNVTNELPKLVAGQEITGKVGVRENVKYAKIEYGWGRVEERPYLRPALAKNKTKFNENLKSAIAGITK